VIRNRTQSADGTPERLHAARVQRLGFLGKGSADYLRSHPLLASHQILKVTECRIASIGLELVPGRA
jgi:hypothetical protein